MKNKDQPAERLSIVFSPTLDQPTNWLRLQQTNCKYNFFPAKLGEIQENLTNLTSVVNSTAVAWKGSKASWSLFSVEFCVVLSIKRFCV